MDKIKKALKLFLIFFKIGLFTFGGGYAMISVIEEQLVEKYKYITDEDLAEIIAVAESTPGPIAINSATFIGYKRAGVLGSIFATLGVVLPSFIIIYIISLFFDEFLKIKLVKRAFMGVKCGVGVLIVSAGVKMLSKMNKDKLSFIIFIATALSMLAINIFAINFSSLYFILIGGVVGIVFCLLNKEGKV